MRYIILMFMVLSCCGRGYVGYNDSKCSADTKHTMEALVAIEHEELAANTEMCYSSIGNVYRYTKEGLKSILDRCGPMPEIVDVECYANCYTQYFNCYILHEDGFLLHVERKFGKKKKVISN